MYLHSLGGLEEDPAGQDALTTCPPGRRGPRATASPASSAPSPPALCLAQDLAASQSGVGGGSRWLMVLQLPLFPMFNVRLITLPEVVVPFPLGTPKTRVRQGVLGDVGDHSWEGCGPFSLVGPAQNPCRPALSQALTISQPPPLGRTNSFVSPRAATRRPGLGSGPGCPKVPPPGAFNKGWYFPGSPLSCGAVAGTLTSATSSPAWPRALTPTPFFFSEKQMPSHWAVAGSPSSTHRVPLDPPPMCLSPLLCDSSISRWRGWL